MLGEYIIMRQQFFRWRSAFIFIFPVFILMCATTLLKPIQPQIPATVIAPLSISPTAQSITLTPIGNLEFSTTEIDALQQDIEILKMKINLLSNTADNSLSTTNQLNEKVSVIDSRLATLEEKITDNPEKALEIVLIKKDIALLNNEVNNNQEQFSTFSTIYNTFLTIVIAIVTLPYLSSGIRSVVDYLQSQSQPRP